MINQGTVEIDDMPLDCMGLEELAEKAVSMCPLLQRENDRMFPVFVRKHNVTAAAGDVYPLIKTNKAL